LKVWDLPTRLFHWLIVLTVAFSWYSAETGIMDWHYRSGIAALVLLAFRLIWGVIGGSTARFTSFVRSPAAVLVYVRRSAGKPIEGGHSPIGAYSVVAMLLALMVQIVSGLLAVDIDGIESGPLSYLISFDQGRIAANTHEISFSVLQALIALHVLAILYYRIRGRKLIEPMVTGRDPQLPPNAAGVTGGGTARAAVALVLAALIGWWINLGAPL
jgi:cytochrome b